MAQATIHLTERERQCLRLLIEGLTNKEIAGRLKIRLATAEGYIQNAYRKLGVNSRIQAYNKIQELFPDF